MFIVNQSGLTKQKFEYAIMHYYYYNKIYIYHCKIEGRAFNIRCKQFQYC